VKTGPGRAVPVKATRLERAAEKVRSAEYKRALGDLWYAEAEHRADKPGLRDVYALADVVASNTKGRVRKDADLLVSVLKSDLERLSDSGAGAFEAVPRERSRLAEVLGLLAVAALLLGIAFLVSAVATFDLSTSGTQLDVSTAFLYAAFGCGALFVVAAIGCAIAASARARGRRRRKS
jgi:hypothetical protein